MPLITIEAGKADKETKARLARELTQKASEILKIREDAFLLIYKENEMDNIATGGKLLSEVLKK